MIPIRLREQMNIQIGKEYSFSTLIHEGRRYICIDCGGADEGQIDDAIKLVESLGYKLSRD